jgi:nucleoside-diphosphate-sugar epimerase
MLRYFNVYGENSKAGHFLADQITKIKSGVFEIIGPEETRSFCHVEDAVAASIYCAQNVDCDVVNIGNDREVTIAFAAGVIANALGHPSPMWITRPGLAGSTTNRRPDITKLKTLWADYSPMPFEQGISKILG